MDAKRLKKHNRRTRDQVCLLTRAAGNVLEKALVRKKQVKGKKVTVEAGDGTPTEAEKHK